METLIGVLLLVGQGGGGFGQPFLAAKAAHGATQCGPCCWHLTSRNLPQPSTMFHNILEASRTFQKIPELFRYPKYNLPYMKFYLRTIPELLMTSWIPSETPNNLRSHHQKYPITTLASTNVKCVTLRVRECVDMIETPLRSITISGTWMPMMAPTHSKKIFIEIEPLCRGLKTIRILFPLSRDISLTRDSIVGITIPSSISFLVSTIYSFL